MGSGEIYQFRIETEIHRRSFAFLEIRNSPRSKARCCNFRLEPFMNILNLNNCNSCQRINNNVYVGYNQKYNIHVDTY